MKISLKRTVTRRVIAVDRSLKDEKGPNETSQEIAHELCEEMSHRIEISCGPWAAPKGIWSRIWSAFRERLKRFLPWLPLCIPLYDSLSCSKAPDWLTVPSNMKPTISEFSYGFAVVDELINRKGFGLEAAPIFPSLYQEGITGGGYDVFLNTKVLPLFLQFKLSDYMVRRTAFEVDRAIMTVPFFRMPLRSRRKSRQHELLMGLENQGNAVFYVAPRFWSAEDLNENFLNDRIIDQSVFIRPSAIGLLPDDDEHHVAFEAAANEGYFCSRPLKITDEITFQGHTKYLHKEFSTHSFDLTHETASRLLVSLQRLIARDWLFGATAAQPGDSSSRPKGKRSDVLADLLRKLLFVSRCYFGCDMLFITAPNK